MIYIIVYILMFVACLAGYRRNAARKLHPSLVSVSRPYPSASPVDESRGLNGIVEETNLGFPYWSFIVLLFFFVAFRWDVGCDFRNYEHNFLYGASYMDLLDAFQNKEPGYWATQVWLREAGFPWEWLNVLSAIAFFVGLHALARRQPNPLMFLALCFPALILGVAMSAVRQAAAVGFVCFAFNAFSDKKLSFYVLFIFVATMFHTSALAFLAAAPFLMPLGAKARVVIGALSLAPSYLLLTGTEAYETYSSMYVGTQTDAAGGIFRALPVALSGVWFFAMHKKWKEYYAGDVYLFEIFSWPLILVFPLVLYSSVMGDRFGYYLMPIAFAIQVRAYNLYAKDIVFFVFLIPLLAGLVLLVAWTQLSQLFVLCYLPYQTWLNR